MLKPQDQEKYQAGLRHLEAGNLGTAENCLRAVVAANPAFAEAQFNLGLILRKRRKLQPAAHCFRSAIRIAPDLAEAHGALGAVLQRTGEEAEAERHVRAALAIRPSLPFARFLLGDLLRAQCRLGEARQVYDALLEQVHDQPDARFGRAFLDLLEGSFGQGFADYEFRPARRAPRSPALQPEWRGEDLAGRRILVYAEQGFGDTIQFMRFVPRLADMGAKVLVAAPAPLAGLIAELNGVHEIVQASVELPPFDYSCPLPSLPFRLNLGLDAIPASAGYLRAPAARLAQWRLRLGSTSKPSIALVWAGNPDHPNDHNRSISAEDVSSLLRIPGLRWLSLQTGPEAGALRRHRHAEFLDLGPALSDFADTAAVAALADLVISVDTAFCHLAGALGRPTWTLLPFAPDWRWLQDRRDSPWYASMRLFRQGPARDWAAVVAEVSNAIRAEFAHRM